MANVSRPFRMHDQCAPTDTRKNQNAKPQSQRPIHVAMIFETWPASSPLPRKSDGTTYGSTWPYTAYSYYPPQQPHAQTAAGTSRGATTANVATTSAGVTSATAVSATATPTIATAAAPALASGAAATSSSATPMSAAPMQRTFSTTPYTYPSYRESYTGRSSGRKSTYRGLFTKERAYLALITELSPIMLT